MIQTTPDQLVKNELYYKFNGYYKKGVIKEAQPNELFLIQFTDGVQETMKLEEGMFYFINNDTKSPPTNMLYENRPPTVDVAPVTNPVIPPSIEVSSVVDKVEEQKNEVAPEPEKKILKKRPKHDPLLEQHLKNEYQEEYESITGTPLDTGDSDEKFLCKYVEMAMASDLRDMIKSMVMKHFHL